MTAPHDTHAPIQWPAIIPLAKTDLPPFPVDVLPARLREWVRAKAEETQTPPDLAAAAALATVSAACAKAWRIEVRAGWREPLNLWFAPVIGPAARATSVFESATAPLQIHQQELATEVQDRNEQNDLLLKILKKRQDAAIARAAKADGDGERQQYFTEATMIGIEVANRTAMPLPQFVTKDATPTAVVDLLAENHGRLAVISSEGGQFGRLIEMASRNRGGDLDHFLSAHAGESITRDRARRRVTISGPALTMGLRLHPDRLKALRTNTGVRESGLRARWLYLMPESRVGQRCPAPASMTDATSHAYEGLIRSLLHTSLEALDAGKIRTLDISDGALSRVVEFATRTEPRHTEGGDLQWAPAWAGKIVGHAVRLAGVFHLTEGKNVETVAEETAARAIALAEEYFIPHARVALVGAEGEPDVARASAVLSGIRRGGHAEVTRREVHRAHQTLFPLASDTDPVLRLLQDHHYLMRIEQPRSPSGGRSKSPRFAVNPAVHETAIDTCDRTDATGTPDERPSLLSHVSE